MNYTTWNCLPQAAEISASRKVGRTHNFPWTAISCARASTLILASRRGARSTPCIRYAVLELLLGAWRSFGRALNILAVTALKRSGVERGALKTFCAIAPRQQLLALVGMCSFTELPLLATCWSPVNLPIYDSTFIMEPHIEVAVIIMGSVNSGMARKPKCTDTP